MSLLSAVGGSIKASGGTTVTTFTDSNGDEYQIHAFESVGSDTFTVDSAPYNATVDVLVVGAGGTTGGEVDHGGGGAGGVVFEEGFSVDEGTYQVVVGDGPSGQSSRVEPADAEHSEFGDPFNGGLRGIAGGTGEWYDGSNYQDGGDGGSGGGESEQSGSRDVHSGNGIQPSSQWGGYGSDGGKVFGTSNNSAAGGGGAIDQGEDVPSGSSVPGNGGDGIDMSSYFGNNFGENGYFAGGGGGGGDDGSSSDGRGGLGGGGDGSLNPTGRVATDGMPNTGGGGGGSTNQGSNAQAESGGGGSGIVLVRYKI